MMLCAVCLYEMKTHYPTSPTRLIADEAVTIANGQAVCIYHFGAIAYLVTPDYGQAALQALRNLEVQGYSKKAESVTPAP